MHLEDYYKKYRLRATFLRMDWYEMHGTVYTPEKEKGSQKSEKKDGKIDK